MHIWRVPLDESADVDALRPILSADERGRADRFLTDDLRIRYTRAHGWLRLILASYVDTSPAALQFEVSATGKPTLLEERVAFNLSHSGDIALIAVTSGARVGVDVERWNSRVEYMRVAERFFSPHERGVLRDLAANPARLAAGFYAAWTRKEAYLKARGDGISRGLHHFDVSLAHNEDARLLVDRLDEDAPRQWAMRTLDVSDGYGGAVVMEGALHEVVWLELADHGRAG